VSARPRRPPGAELPPRRIRYRAPAGWQYALLVAAWAGAIGLVALLSRGVPPHAQTGWPAGLRVAGPVAAAFVLTLAVLVRPRGPWRTHDAGPGPEDFTVVAGWIRLPGGGRREAAATVPTVAGPGGLAREETSDLALAELRREVPGCDWAGEPALREATPAERDAARRTLGARDDGRPVAVAAEPRSAARAVGAILLGCAWVSMLPLAVVAVREGYARAVLAPVCRAHGVGAGLASRGVRFSISAGPWWWEAGAGPEAACLYGRPGEAGAVEVPLERAAGRPGSVLLVTGGAAAVVLGGLLLWAGPTALAGRWALARWSRAAAGGPDAR
jgi:hypothetical protein